ncbi:GNAT family N-acetyltransferase [Prosthecobacter vanneervenii]|uniref:RimJ/RimL family protein N-acetyltransferase n=1 Tax=Prosthecobacter vanneervenii TaxID=48466 RepID=A0A7W8DK55_9BACT|nr:GNAT family N-acetyltransferase [Prosthecobacter vanneervenii]MBB5032705.1 RimJ/RimL family protein N-acetyltransferase [Prosthecobacter vanneervenii]
MSSLLSRYRLLLRDELPVILRPLTPDDRERITDAFRRLSPESMYFRFWTRVQGANPKFIERLCADDDGQHRTWVIVIENNDEIPGVGGGSYWRSDGSEDSAEVSFTVADEFQGQGVGTILLAVLWVEALESGIRQFVAYVLDENHVMLTWWASLGAAHERQPHGGWELTLRLDESLLPDTSAAGSLRRTMAGLRAASKAA